ncbi:SPARC-related modular calcium-binding protein 1-like [Nylanderia fulva]|uniref:SPARC-related modular calcium-binding protein 1-like n=1 Tax=Nylanderia fulva TaxID=613905 RepID=UPI0010FB3C17|nr:SPARC-related modular calcium-binding protein 1-like [Nylanderia fulva]
MSKSNDCMSDRNSAIEDQKHNSQEKYYVPLCTSDGRYHRVQCYSGYCWCVLQDTGKPIPGTSSQNRTPNCNPVPTPSRPIKGCPELKKQLFLRDLMNLMQEQMTASTDSDETTTKWQASKEERIATWHFVMLDKNKNKVLEKKEWKTFRTMVANNRQLRRCGKKLPRYCDINNDRRISMTEWLSCLNAQHPITVYKWFHNFRSGRMSTSDAEHSGRPVEATIPKIIDKIHDMVMDDRRVKVRKITSAVSILSKWCKKPSYKKNVHDSLVGQLDEVSTYLTNTIIDVFRTNT